MSDETQAIEKTGQNMAGADLPGTSPDQIIVSNDWTRNWQAKIAVKIAAMFIWVLIMAAFSGVVYFSHSLDQRIEESLHHDLDSISHRLQSKLQSLPTLGPQSLEAALFETIKEEIAYSHYDGVTLDLDNVHLVFGLTSEREFGTRFLTLFHLKSAGTSQYETTNVQLKAYHLPVSTIVENERNHLILGVIVILVIFGLMLIWAIHNVLSKPLRALTGATQSVSAGELGLRLDTSREDEFGCLSRFFNQMLDRVQEHQLALSASNQELIREIGVRKQVEAELRSHRDELEKLVEVRTKDLEVARDMALQASQSKSAFIANVSHEVRTPLTPIIGFAESMLQDDPPPETRKALLTSIIRNGRHLFNIINEILDVSKIEANKLEIEKIDVDISQLFLDIESIIGTLARDKGLSFHTAFSNPVPSRFHTDPTRIRQILMNLLTNAVKFTEKGNISLLAEFDPALKHLRFTISDTGIGIPQDKQDRLFKAFSQADSSTTRRYGGTGLGLYISQRLAHLLGGDITASSLDGIGSKFILSIPGEGLGDLIREPRETCTLSYSATECLTEFPRLKGHILLAEDTLDNQHLICHYIGKTGATVSVADNGQIAVEMAMSHDYDLILMDMQMPLMSGLEAVELLRATGCQTPIVALTANAMKGDREHYTRIGCNDFLGKPIRQSVFFETLAKYVPADSTDGNLMSADDTPDHKYLELQASFQASLPGYTARLQTALSNQDWAMLKDEAHKLKGMGGSFGFPAITQHAAALDTALKSPPDATALKQLCEMLCDTLTHAASIPLKNS